MEKLITPDIGVIFWTIVTFIVLLVILGRYAWKPILSMIEAREKLIQGSIDQAEKTKTEAEALLKQQKEMIEKTRTETAQMLEAGKQEAEKARSELIEQAKILQQEIIAQGKMKIEQETRSAVEQIKTNAADLAIAAAGRLIEVSLDERSRKKLVEEYIDELSKKKLS